MQCSLNKDHQHLKWQPQKSWTSFPNNQVAQDKQRTQYLLKPNSRWRMHPHHWKFQTRNVQAFRFVNHDTKCQNHCPVWKTQSFLLSEICLVIFLARLFVERQFEKAPVKHGWEKVFNLRMFIRTPWTRIILICVCGWHKETKSW